MNRRSFFCGLAVSPLALLSEARPAPARASDVHVTIRIKEIDLGIDTKMRAVIAETSRKVTTDAIRRG